jgi:LacI family transcriptional regulator
VYTCVERLRGHREAHADARVPVDPALVRLGLDEDGVEPAIRDLLDLPRPPTAVLASQNLLTIGAIHALRRFGAQRRVALVGFDDIPLADALEPSVTVVAQRPVALGRAAADLLFARIDGSAGPARHVVVDTDLIERDSTRLPVP